MRQQRHRARRRLLFRDGAVRSCRHVCVGPVGSSISATSIPTSGGSTRRIDAAVSLDLQPRGSAARAARAADRAAIRFASVFVSEREAATFRSLAPEAADRVIACRNGVDVAYFDPPAVPHATGALRRSVCRVHRSHGLLGERRRRHLVRERRMAAGAGTRTASSFSHRRIASPRTKSCDCRNQAGVVVTGCSARRAAVSAASARCGSAAARCARRAEQSAGSDGDGASRRGHEPSVQGLDARPPEDVLVSDRPDEFGAVRHCRAPGAARSAIGGEPQLRDHPISLDAQPRHVRVAARRWVRRGATGAGDRLVAPGLSLRISSTGSRSAAWRMGW